jgi:hypothetical protein
MLDIKNNNFLTIDEIKSKAPSIFTKTGSENTSEKYVHMSTDTVINDMELLGWKVVDVKQVKARKNIGFQKHLVVFRNNDIVINGADGDTAFPQILLTNSHDGKNSFTFQAGIFRMICENGLVVSTQDFNNVKIRHVGYSFEELQTQIKIMVEKLPLTVESMNKLKNIELNQEQILEFAKQAIATRFEEDKIKRVKINLGDLVIPTRKEDKEPNLWNVFNIVQEKIMHGGITYELDGKIRKLRKINNFNQDIEINKRLWEVTESFC